MCEFENDKEEDPRETRSYPMTPRGMKNYEEFDFLAPQVFQSDNVYAESKPYDPLAKIGKTYVEIGLQACNISTKIGMDLPLTADGLLDDY